MHARGASGAARRNAAAQRHPARTTLTLTLARRRTTRDAPYSTRRASASCGAGRCCCSIASRVAKPARLPSADAPPSAIAAAKALSRRRAYRAALEGSSDAAVQPAARHGLWRAPQCESQSTIPRRFAGGRAWTACAVAGQLAFTPAPRAPVSRVFNLPMDPKAPRASLYPSFPAVRPQKGAYDTAVNGTLVPGLSALRYSCERASVKMRSNSSPSIDSFSSSTSATLSSTGRLLSTRSLARR